VLHPADDIAYFFTDNIVHKLNNTSWTEAVLTLPSNLTITDAEPVGNFLAIACQPKDTTDKSVVFLWDRDSSLTTISGKIDWGEGNLLYIAMLDGVLVGVTDWYLNNIASFNEGRFVVKTAVGERSKIVRQKETPSGGAIPFSPNSLANLTTKIVRDDKMYFPVATTDGSGNTLRGVGVVDSTGGFTLHYVEEEATSIEGIFSLGNYWFIAHSNDGSINRTDDNGNYNFTSIYETRILSMGDSSRVKKLLRVTVITEPLMSGEQVVVKYKKDDDTTFATTVLTHSTTNEIQLSSEVDSNGNTLPNFREITFRLESTGGARITGLKYDYYNTETL